jgi:group II intron reverse transcriptase/maturase
VVQAALKNILEPIFEAGFNPNSYGFRPGKSVHGALEHVRKLLNSWSLRASSKTEVKLPYQWAIEGDIKGCFDNISHHELMENVRARIADNKINRLIPASLKAGVMSEGKFFRTQIGTPQGGILSPLLANIALDAIDKRYERHSWPRTQPTPLTSKTQIVARATGYRCNDKQRGKPVFNCIRYADDFIVFVSAPIGAEQSERAKTLAEKEKAELAGHLKDSMGLELSAEKTIVTPVTRSLDFLGHHAKVRWNPKYGWESVLLIPKAKSQKLRNEVKALFHYTTCNQSLESRLKRLNPLLRGWGYFYRHAFGAKKVFAAIDRYVWFTIYRWLMKKYSRPNKRKLNAMHGWRKQNSRMTRWRDGSLVPFELATISVHRFKHAWQHPPNFMATSTESPVRIERRTPGSEEGDTKTAS